MSRAIAGRGVKHAATNFVADVSEDGHIVEQFFASLDTPKSLAASLLFKYNEHEQLLDLDISPGDYLSDQSDKYHRDYLAVSFLSKNDSLKTSYDKKARGLAKFFLFEEQCKVTNSRFRLYSELERSEYATWIFSMRRKIDLILGEFDIEEFFDKSAWGPGVSTLIRGEDTSATRKFQSEIGITRDAYALMSSSLSLAYPSWFGKERLFDDSTLTFEVGNTVTTVPKNSKIDRVIAVEPGLNLFFQKGVGSMIKSRLRKRGIDLTDQRANQQLARIGSLDQSVATVDFSSASDSISKELVQKLLPLRWFVVMDALRSKVALIEGKPHTWEKFSSMGNGFTFELESLIFYAAALTTCEFGLHSGPISVYGDDVILPVEAFDPYEKFCAYLGFTVNTEKSFSTGYFRESCGSHYFSGSDVKPIFHKKVITDAFSIYKLANSIRRLSHRRNYYYGCDRRFLGTWRRILQGLPLALRSVRIPEGYGDGGILVNFDEACPPRAVYGIEGFNVLMLSQRGTRKSQSCHGLLLERLTQISGSLGNSRKWVEEARKRSFQGLSDLAYGNDTTLRRLTKVGASLTLVHSWYDLGEWS